MSASASPHEVAQVNLVVADAEAFGADPARVQRAASLLTPAERERYARYRHDADRRMFALGREMARTLVGRALGVDPASWTWHEGPHGRPEIGAPPTDLHFNLSHSGQLVVCAIGRRRELGVDVEDLERRPPDRAVVARYCSPAEAADVDACGRRWPERFLTYWTLKEAYLKARGLGISVALADITFSIDGDRVSVRFERSLEGTDSRWAFHLWRPTRRHLAAAAASAPDAVAPVFTVRSYP